MASRQGYCPLAAAAPESRRNYNVELNTRQMADAGDERYQGNRHDTCCQCNQAPKRTTIARQQTSITDRLLNTALCRMQLSRETAQSTTVLYEVVATLTSQHTWCFDVLCFASRHRQGDQAHDIDGIFQISAQGWRTGHVVPASRQCSDQNPDTRQRRNEGSFDSRTPYDTYCIAMLAS
ncbi:hypothetical protein OPT61_g3517 [Boeremia exigua]|uniref:Uncharacterized protein n=1 Tax=Boeremia exigua TaxID=749465 RepID=A0ACC2IHM1_9PLEO|nr:hypothetical protein OPT61_g3517 [Boeremia exigua]